MSNVLGIDIGGTHFRVGVFDREGRRLVVSEGDTQRSGGREWMLERIRERCQALLANTDVPIEACGVSFGGPVDFARQRVTSIHTPGWKDFALAQWVEENFRLPCRIDNDANAGALGEYHFGAGQGTDSMAYITISTGIGSGVIYGGKVIRGKDGLAGELGHLPVSDSGAPCSCGGSGCLETFCSGSAIAQRAHEWGQRRPERIARMVELSGGGEITAKGVFQAAAEGDMAAANIVREAARFLARGLLAVLRMLNPDKIILGGGVALAGPVFLTPVRGFLEEFSSPSFKYTTEIMLSKLGSHSALYGAAVLGLEAEEGASSYR